MNQALLLFALGDFSLGGGGTQAVGCSPTRISRYAPKRAVETQPHGARGSSSNICPCIGFDLLRNISNFHN